MSLRIVNWNVEWACRNKDEILRRIGKHSPDAICLTETHCDFLPSHGHQIESEADYGYPMKEGRRKVVLWSRNPWIDVDTVGHPDLPPGRFVAGRTTCSDIGEIMIIGVCIPWSKAHVDSGRRDRTAWEDHIAYLNGLENVLRDRGDERLLVVGDFNQRTSGQWVCDDAKGRLKELFSKHLEVATSGVTFCGKEAIDHLAHTRDLASYGIEAISNLTEGGELSDHFGIALSLRAHHP